MGLFMAVTVWEFELPEWGNGWSYGVLLSVPDYQAVHA